MNPFTFGMRWPEHRWLAGEAHELLFAAQQEAASKGAQEVSLEHFMLAAFEQQNERLMSLLEALELDLPSLHQQILAELGSPASSERYDCNIPLSQEVQQCVDQAIAAVHAHGIAFAMPEHLVLSILSSPRKFSTIYHEKMLTCLSASVRWQNILPLYYATIT